MIDFEAPHPGMTVNTDLKTPLASGELSQEKGATRRARISQALLEFREMECRFNLKPCSIDNLDV